MDGACRALASFGSRGFWIHLRVSKAETVGEAWEWGGEVLKGGPSDWDTPIWEHDLSKGLRILRLAIDTHLVGGVRNSV